MVVEQMFGNEESPLRENSVFRKHMEEYKFFEIEIDKLQTRRGYLSYKETIQLKTLKKLKLSAKDGMEECKQTL
jgi:uncharacterized protein YdcH (DUF465 family)